MSELTLEQALILLDESRQHNAAMLDRLYESLGIDSSDGEIRFKLAMVAIEDIKRERDAALAQVDALSIAAMTIITSHSNYLQYSGLNPDNLKGGEKSIHDMISRLESSVMADAGKYLREVQADAGRAGWIACSEWIDNDDYKFHTVVEAANDYADRVKAGE